MVSINQGSGVFKLQSISVSIDGVKVVEEVSLTIQPGQLHVCMGPNGSGKSSLAYALVGHPRYTTAGDLLLNDETIFTLSPEKRARAGIFLSMQYPQEIPGVSVRTFLRESFRALHPQELMDLFEERLNHALAVLKFDASFLNRGLHEGFSGGEKKRCEMVQLLVLQPKIAILDEIDSGLDVDSLVLVGKALQSFRKICPQSSLFLITHYQKILEYVSPDKVHIMKEGRLVSSGGLDLLKAIQEKGYEQFV